MIDAWRVQHVKDRDYTFFSSVHGSYSRLDYFMVGHRLLERVKDTKIGVTTLSDHAPVLMKVGIPGLRGSPFSWHLDEKLIENPSVSSKIQEEIDGFFSVNDTGEISGSVLWEALRAYIRGILISIGANEKKDSTKRKTELIEEIHHLEQLHKAASGSHNLLLHQLIIKREELKDSMEIDSKHFLNKNLKDRFRWSNKVGKHLATVLKRKGGSNFIDRIQNKKGVLKYTSTDIAEEFRSYFTSLYKVRQGGVGTLEREEKMDEFIREAGLPSLSDSDAKELDGPITVEEIETALKASPSGKSPGPDGFTSYFYKKCKESLIPKLCQIWNRVGGQEELCEGALMASVTLIPKEGKDSSLCSSYRPIALLNADIKLYAKVLASRLKDKMLYWIHSDQTGFIPGRERRDNGVRSLLVMDAMKMKGTPGLLLSINAEKAFDRVDWGFMLRTLRAVGLGGTILNWIKALYKSPSAFVRVNGTPSAEFRMENGTRQSCPLSPLLFALTLEPLLALIRRNPDICGCVVEGDVHKLSAFADDVLFYIVKPRISLPNLLATLRGYRELSNYKVNLSKTVVLNINIDGREATKLKENFHFPWSKNISYLGVTLANSLRKLYRLNLIPLLDEIKLETRKSMHLPISWIGRVNTVKITLAPEDPV
ncbi:hypothetical protein AB205_0061220 [Aquarana catesbeiana]|uniref:Reverse transcriptase domain-containing protein n=1 Tax=Aquarana catesbeiana TaxID=8400 RepID=A0A2G9R7S9_AQUCT|nr:hypothetical protein AB205_0061220 [Aquarana catesbeiana]